MILFRHYTPQLYTIEYFYKKDAIIAVCGQKTPGGPVTYTVSPQPRLDR